MLECVRISDPPTCPRRWCLLAYDRRLSRCLLSLRQSISRTEPSGAWIAQMAFQIVRYRTAKNLQGLSMEPNVCANKAPHMEGRAQLLGTAGVRFCLSRSESRLTLPSEGGTCGLISDTADLQLRSARWLGRLAMLSTRRSSDNRNHGHMHQTFVPVSIRYVTCGDSRMGYYLWMHRGGTDSPALSLFLSMG